jgi:hypothetical protein
METAYTLTYCFPMLFAPDVTEAQQFYLNDTHTPSQFPTICNLSILETFSYYQTEVPRAEKFMIGKPDLY